MLSDLEESTLRAIMLGNKNIKKIAQLINIPEIITEKTIERLVAKGYIDSQLQPTDKAFKEMKWLDRKHGLLYHGEDLKRMITALLDLSIAIAAILLVWAILNYFGLI
jgi:Mn-dependent DtxR family transcriptional regulator